MSRALSILWRGPLDSCNYACGYCPFAKRRARPGMLRDDRAAVERFVDWTVSHTDRPLRILFTPWGEGLVHAWYRTALARLSCLPHVQRVGIQTNGSAAWRWLSDADPARLGLWITWHPDEIGADDFLAHLAPVLKAGAPCSIGCVAVPARLPEMEDLRRRLPDSIGMWLNALRPTPTYTAEQLRRCAAIDPHFHLTIRPHASRGLACRTGASVISVDGVGDVRRCPFVPTVLGNLYHDDLAGLLAEQPCPRRQCDCFFGFAHLEHLHLERAYGNDLLHRLVPTRHGA